MSVKSHVSNIAIFDVDGTLTNTSDVDAECFLESLRITFDVDDRSSDWSVYPDVTDSGILADIVKESRGSEPTLAERHEFINTFVSLLAVAYAADRHRFVEVRGARSFLARLMSLGWTVTVATGGWRASALRKLEYAGFQGGDWPIASADDGRRRAEIVRASIMKAGVAASAEDAVVVFGDAVWDVHAAQELGFPLIGISSDQRADLEAAGAFATIPDYADPHTVLQLMREATAI